MAILGTFFALACVAGLIYQAASALAVRSFMQSPAASPKTRPPISVLKPLCGAEPGLEAHLIGLLRQGYPKLQLICGVADEGDPAVAVVRRVMEQFPDADIALVIDPTRHGNNLKVGNLMNMLPAASHDLLLIADSDVAAHDGYLDQAVAHLADPRVGLVTFLYVGRPLGNWASRLGAAGINHGFLPSALVALWLGRQDGCFGATMAISKTLLTRVGGLDTIKDMLADDWALGTAVRSEGYKIALASRPVDLTVAENDIRSLFDHEVRWGRTIAVVDRPSYIASIITQPVMLALLASLVSAGKAFPLLVVAMLVRVVVVRVQERAFDLPSASVADLLLRDLLSFVVLLTACFGRTVWWRGKRFRVGRDGRLTLLEG